MPLKTAWGTAVTHCPARFSPMVHSVAKVVFDCAKSGHLPCAGGLLDQPFFVASALAHPLFMGEKNG